MYKQIVVANGDEVTIRVPQELANKELEITVEEKATIGESREEKLKKALAFFDSISVDMKDFKFNRDEANER